MLITVEPTTLSTTVESPRKTPELQSPITVAPDEEKPEVPVTRENGKRFLGLLSLFFNIFFLFFFHEQDVLKDDDDVSLGSLSDAEGLTAEEITQAKADLARGDISFSDLDIENDAQEANKTIDDLSDLETPRKDKVEEENGILGSDVANESSEVDNTNLDKNRDDNIACTVEGDKEKDKEEKEEEKGKENEEKMEEEEMRRENEEEMEGEKKEMEEKMDGEREEVYDHESVEETQDGKEDETGEIMKDEYLEKMGAKEVEEEEKEEYFEEDEGFENDGDISIGSGFGSDIEDNSRLDSVNDESR